MRHPSKLILSDCRKCGRSYMARADSKRMFCSRGCSQRFRTSNWKGGLSRMADGRWAINCRDGSRFYFYRAVMSAHLGRLLAPEELVHHIDGDRTNDVLDNLEITTRQEHPRLHADWRG